MVKGEIVSWFDDRDFGFIKQDDIAFGDIFVHRNQIVRGAPRRGARVSFRVETRGPRKRQVANSVEVLS